MKLRVLTLVSSLIVSLFLFTPGCGKATLETGGVYAPAITNADGTVTATQAPDSAFYNADLAFAIAHDGIKTVFDFERNNRDVLWKLSPNIKHNLDKIRPQVVEAETRYAIARKAYIAAPAAANLNTLNGVLQEIQRLSVAAASAIPNK